LAEQFPVTGILITERLMLRWLIEDDVDDVHAWMSDPQVARFQGYEPRSREQVSTVVGEIAASRRLDRTGDFVELGIELPADRASRSRVIGSIYFSITNADDRTAQIGWTVGRAFQGLGYAAEAARAVLDAAFGPLGLHRVFAELDPRNLPSIALCGRLGMRREALFIESMWLKGEWVDSAVYATLDREWRHETA